MVVISPKPNIVWRLFVLAGVGTSAVVSIDDDAWEAFDEATGHTMNRNAIRVLFYGTVAVHVLEGGAAYRSARRAGLASPLRKLRNVSIPKDITFRNNFFFSELLSRRPHIQSICTATESIAKGCTSASRVAGRN